MFSSHRKCSRTDQKDCVFYYCFQTELKWFFSQCAFSAAFLSLKIMFCPQLVLPNLLYQSLALTFQLIFLRLHFYFLFDLSIFSFKQLLHSFNYFLLLKSSLNDCTFKHHCCWWYFGMCLNNLFFWGLCDYLIFDSFFIDSCLSMFIY